MELVQAKGDEVRLLVNDISVGLTIEKAVQAPKVFQLKKELGMEMLIKLVCAIIKAFCDSIRASKTMDAVDILNCAEELVSKYTHDSVKDFIMALKEAKAKGTNFYNSIATHDILRIIDEYMDRKAAFFERLHQDMISQNDGSVRTEAHTKDRERELFQDKMDKINENKKLKEIQIETRELKKVQDIIEKTLNDEETLDNKRD